jgi:hypothetical protein
MSEYYTPQRTKNLYDPSSVQPFKISRSKIDLFLECPRCFYLDRRLGTGRPPGYPFNLNSAVDQLLKNEFDAYRQQGKRHPLMELYNIDALPVTHANLDKWRQNFTGIQYLHEPTRLLVFGAIDDLWQDSLGNYIVVDYKATSKNEQITELNKAWQTSYKRQMEVYQWLLRRNGLPVSDTGYFVYCNGDTARERFDARLEFEITLIPYAGSDTWVEQTMFDIHDCLNRSGIPAPAADCDYCAYVDAVSHLLAHNRL